MIINIDDIYFNPLQIVSIHQRDNDVVVLFTDPTECFVFKNWKISDFAAHINQLIKEF